MINAAEVVLELPGPIFMPERRMQFEAPAADIIRPGRPLRRSRKNFEARIGASFVGLQMGMNQYGKMYSFVCI